MKSQFYSNTILTIIALLIAALVFQNFSKTNNAQNDVRPVSDVRIISIVKPNKKELEQAYKDSTSFLRWDDLPVTDYVDVSGSTVNVNGSVSIDGEVRIDEPVRVALER
jgi:hypothetical protein